MLYQRWREIARKHAPRMALHELATGRRWTFDQLAAVIDSAPRAAGLVAHPRGLGAHFIVEVATAWRDGQIVCPLETDQPPPELPTLPPECAHLKTTSATTAAARLIAFTGPQIAADADNIIATMGLRPEWPSLGLISLAHSYGFSNLVTPLLLGGIPLVLADSPLPESFRRAAASVSDCTVAAVPALWRTWLEAGVLGSSIRLAISAGAPLPVALEEEIFSRHSLKVHNFYGASECGGIAFDRSATPRQDASCVGQAMENVRLRTIDGCLQVRSQAVGQTYWPEAVDTLAPGIFRTSDLAELRDGNVLLRGRASDQMNVAGRKISPESIERLLLTHPSVKACVVFGAPSADADRSDSIVACLQTVDVLDAGALRHFLLDKVPAWQIPRDWWFVDSIPTNARGKISRADWRQRYLAR